MLLVAFSDGGAVDVVSALDEVFGRVCWVIAVESGFSLSEIRSMKGQLFRTT